MKKTKVSTAELNNESNLTVLIVRKNLKRFWKKNMKRRLKLLRINTN